jgi:hypothetical protein
MSTRVPALLARLVDDASVCPPGNAPLAEAVAAHHRHRAAWYADLVGPLLVPVSLMGDSELTRLVDREIEVGLIGDTGLDRVAPAAAALLRPARLRQIEVAVARRGEDPQPGLARLVEVAGGLAGVRCFAEIPLAWGLLGALDTVAAARAAGVDLLPKFRTGGLAAELFPTPIELAAVICGCRDRGLRFKLTAGLHHAVRYADPETGFVHHGFLNVLAGAATAAAGADVAEVAPVLAGTDPALLMEQIRPVLDQERPLWIGFGTCSVAEPLHDLTHLGLL